MTPELELIFSVVVGLSAGITAGAVAYLGGPALSRWLAPQSRVIAGRVTPEALLRKLPRGDE